MKSQRLTWRSVGKSDKPQNQMSADDVDAAFERFKKKYEITEADLEKKDRAKIIPFAGTEEASEELAPDLVTEADLEKKDRAKIIPFAGTEEASEELAPDLGEIAAMEGIGQQAETEEKVHRKKEHTRGGRKDRGKSRRFWNTAGGRVAIAFLSVFSVLAATGICTSASADDVDAAFERFKKKYEITEADLEKKDRAKIIPFAGTEEVSEELAPDLGKVAEMEGIGQQAETEEAHGKPEHVRGGRRDSGKSRRFWNTAGGRVAIAFLSVFSVLAATGICTSAVQQKPFFEIVRDGMNSMKITVTGNEMESQTELTMESSEKVYYESWDEIKAENPEVVVPGYIPEKSCVTA